MYDSTLGYVEHIPLSFAQRSAIIKSLRASPSPSQSNTPSSAKNRHLGTPWLPLGPLRLSRPTSELMNMLKTIGAKIEPCGRPQDLEMPSERSPLTASRSLAPSNMSEWTRR